MKLRHERAPAHLVIRLAGKCERHHEHAVDLKAGVPCLRLLDSANQKTRAGEQDHAQGELRREKRASQSPADARHLSPSHERLHGRLRDLERRGKSEQHACQSRDPQCEDEHPCIRRNSAGDLVADGAADNQRWQRVCNQQRYGSGAARQHEAFGQELSDHTAPAGAERQTNGELTLAGKRPRQQQVADIGAGQEQHEYHRGEHQREDRHQRCLQPGLRQKSSAAED